MAKVNPEVVRITKAVEKALRIRDKKSIHDLAREVGSTRQFLARIMFELVRDGKAERHKGRPPVYSKPSPKKA